MGGKMNERKIRVYQKVDGYGHRILIENGDDCVGIDYDWVKKIYNVVPQSELPFFKRVFRDIEGVLLDEEDVLPILEQSRKSNRIDEKTIAELINKHLEAIISTP